MTNKTLSDREVSDYWYTWFMEGPPPNEQRLRSIFRLFPAEARCSYCLAPFTGIGSWLARAALDKHRSSHHPGFCNVCDHFAQAYGGGADVDMAMLFMDIRGSTQLSTQLSSRAFSQKIESFYGVSTQIITAANGFVERLAGDEVIAYFGPGLTGEDYVKNAIHCGLEILAATGHQAADGPEIPLGGSVHAGSTFFGSVLGPNKLYSITALGAEVNTAARIAAQAETGELLVSHQAMQAAQLRIEGHEERALQLKGLPEPIRVAVLRPSALD